MFAIMVKMESTFGNNIENSKFVKRARHLEKISQSKSDVKLIQEYGQKMLSDAQSFVPVRTGNLRDAITLEQTSTGFRFFVNEQKAPYGKYVEMGTRRQNAQAFYWPSVDRNKERMIAALVAHYRGKG